MENIIRLIGYMYLYENNPNANPWDKLYVVKKSDSTGHFTEYSYDNAYRITSVRRPLGRNTFYT